MTANRSIELQHALQCAQGKPRGSTQTTSSWSRACCTTSAACAPAVAGISGDGPREDHGETGSRWLGPRVGERVARLAAAHVQAKRYLVAVDAVYESQLKCRSPARTLQAQGGAMSDGEIERFRNRPDWERAVSLRRIDDLGKIAGLQVPGLESYRDTLLRVIEATLGAARP